ncbi:alpha/beta fold hydrolase [Phytohabitans sp. ZYX-F-186]|uniref:Alpha/beta fold hydrolase n=1 Tax=Phytohabitans maris TaxID=3071409 RepID=A0ABU0ZDP4_9ACTN|nr:thioesterase domain-containing protein [Phytohabitans sp. ZYX-F-186]MDQ7905179.1 alpha/beta fold hydrolase [Phytohabitans sp. ZYX-F-186]
MNPWFRIHERDPEAPMRLYCLPYAGGSASLYRGWGAGLTGVAEVVAVQLPGRENRIGEPPVAAMSILVDRLTRAMLAEPARPYALFGYSMGARVAHHAAHVLAAAGRPPQRLFVAASPGPAAPPGPAAHHLSEPDLVAHLRRLGGTPDEVLDSAELRRLVLPAVRADLAAVETAPRPPGPPLSCPVHAFAGRTDPEASPDRMAAWGVETRGDFILDTFDAGHFFVHADPAGLLARVRSGLIPAPAHPAAAPAAVAA